MIDRWLHAPLRITREVWGGLLSLTVCVHTCAYLEMGGYAGWKVNRGVLSNFGLDGFSHDEGDTVYHL